MAAVPKQMMAGQLASHCISAGNEKKLKWPANAPANKGINTLKPQHALNAMPKAMFVISSI